MRFIHNNLGHRKQGEIIEVSLTSGANVRLMDNANFSCYKNGRRYQYIGGLAKFTPLQLPIPATGHWHVAIDMQGLRGETKASVRVLPGTCAKMQQPSISSRSGATQNDILSSGGAIEKVCDIFISHSPEDKDDIVRQLDRALSCEGLTVWCDEVTLRSGDSLRQRIKKGLAKSQLGLIILSTSFIGKGWASYELDDFFLRAVPGERKLLPIWHNITKQQIVDFSPLLANEVAPSTATHTVGEIVLEIARQLKNKQSA